jgi:beta-galactosidase
MPGILRAEAVDEQGTPIAEMNMGRNTLHTAGEPYAIRLVADRTTIKADGQDLAFITVEVVDKHGVVCPNATNELSLSVQGPGTLAAFGNADIKELGSTVDAVHNVWKGRALAVLRSSMKKGGCTLSVSGKGLRSQKVRVNVK